MLVGSEVKSAMEKDAQNFLVQEKARVMETAIREALECLEMNEDLDIVAINILRKSLGMELLKWSED